MRGLERILSIRQREVTAKLHELAGTSLLHPLNELRRTERRSTLLQSTKLSGLRDDRLKTQRGLDVRNVLLLRSLPLLLRSHLTGEGLLLSRIPLASGSEDVLERFLRLTIGDIARGLTGLEQAHGLRPALDIGIGDRLAHGTGLAERGEVAEDIAGSSSTGAGGLLSGPDQRGISGTSLSESGGNLTLQVAADGASGTDILRSSGKPNLLVARGSDLFFWNGPCRYIPHELAIEAGFIEIAIPLWIESLKLGATLLGESNTVLAGSLKLRPRLFGG